MRDKRHNKQSEKTHKQKNFTTNVAKRGIIERIYEELLPSEQGKAEGVNEAIDLNRGGKKMDRERNICKYVNLTAHQTEAN